MYFSGLFGWSKEIILFMLSLGTNFQIFCSFAMCPEEQPDFLVLCWEVRIIKFDSLRNWHIISPTKGHFPAEQLMQSFLSQGQSQALCPLKAWKNFCSSTLQVPRSQLPTWLWWWLSKIKNTALGIERLIFMTEGKSHRALQGKV